MHTKVLALNVLSKILMKDWPKVWWYENLFLKGRLRAAWNVSLMKWCWHCIYLSQILFVAIQFSYPALNIFIEMSLSTLTVFKKQLLVKCYQCFNWCPWLDVIPISTNLVILITTLKFVGTPSRLVWSRQARFELWIVFSAAGVMCFGLLVLGVLG